MNPGLLTNPNNNGSNLNIKAFSSAPGTGLCFLCTSPVRFEIAKDIKAPRSSKSLKIIQLIVGKLAFQPKPAKCLSPLSSPLFPAPSKSSALLSLSSYLLPIILHLIFPTILCPQEEVFCLELPQGALLYKLPDISVNTMKT